MLFLCYCYYGLLQGGRRGLLNFAGVVEICNLATMTGVLASINCALSYTGMPAEEEAERATFPTAEERKRCWMERDKYLQCLEKHAVDAIYRENDAKGTVRFLCPTVCESLQREAGKHCPALWLLHFERKWALDQLRTNGDLAFNKGL